MFIVLLEEIGESASVKTAVAFFNGLLEDGLWAQARIEGSYPKTRLVFPPTDYERMPLHFFLEAPSHISLLGSRWVLRGEDGVRVEGNYQLTEENIHPSERGPDLLAFYRGE